MASLRDAQLSYPPQPSRLQVNACRGSPRRRNPHANLNEWWTSSVVSTHLTSIWIMSAKHLQWFIFGITQSLLSAFPCEHTIWVQWGFFCSFFSFCKLIAGRNFRKQEVFGDVKKKKKIKKNMFIYMANSQSTRREIWPSSTGWLQSHPQCWWSVWLIAPGVLHTMQSTCIHEKCVSMSGEAVLLDFMYVFFSTYIPLTDRITVWKMNI